MRTRVPIAVIVAGFALFAAACGGADSESASGDTPLFVEQGSQTVDTSQLSTTTDGTDPGAGGAAEGDGNDGEPGADPDDPASDGGTTTTTLPQNEQSQSENIDDLFTAMRTFNGCLEDEGTSFLGVPSAELPDDDPRNSSSYLESLQKCASISRIQEAFAAADLGSEGKTPEEIELQNRGLVAFSDCLKGRGWNPAAMTPDENGLLEIGDLGAPEGENFFDSDDIDECRRIGTEQVEAEIEAEG